jgi:alpha-ketoglutarate-dependent 2,4-dichlorophenoxyacetate dioxygenase
MSLTITPLHPLFAAEITGVDLSQPIDESAQRAIERAMDQHAVCVLPSQTLDDDRQIAFARLYGPLEVSPPVQTKSGSIVFNTRVQHREVFDVSNLDEHGGILDEQDLRAVYRLGNQLWHTDSSFRQKSAAWSMLHARVIPPTGGDTEFADTRSGRNALYVASHASHIIGMPTAEGQALLAELIEFATQPRFVYRHKWRLGDLVIWDNRCTMHRATPFEATGHVRDMRRTTIIDVHAEAAVA